MINIPSLLTEFNWITLLNNENLYISMIPNSHETAIFFSNGLEKLYYTNFYGSIYILSTL